MGGRVEGRRKGPDHEVGGMVGNEVGGISLPPSAFRLHGGMYE